MSVPALYLARDRWGADRFAFTCADGAVTYSGLSAAECRRAVTGLCDPDEARSLIAILDSYAPPAVTREAGR